MRAMAQSSATTVEAYLAELPPGRRFAVSALRKLIVATLPATKRKPQTTS